ncbi:MAG: ABC transporter ATP-binding protein [Nanoarchaeota archaeon]|nr:ABC transporter ATP-binding protein [Nanoarchaeota archaeon]
MSYISLKGIKKSLGRKQILNGISFDINKGDFWGIIGPSGSGKTTLLRVLIGFYKPDAGSITTQDDFDAKEIGYATQENSFYFDLTVMENFHYFGSMQGIPRREVTQRAQHLLKLVGLEGTEKLLAEKLSGGMKRRLDLAISLITDPSVLILDEITTGLDPSLKEHIMGIIRHINKEGVTVIYATHQLEEVERYCNRLVLLHNGYVLESTTPGRLKKQIKDFDVIKLETKSRDYEVITDDLKRYDHKIHYYSKDENFLYIFTSNSALDIQNLTHIIMKRGEDLISVDLEKPSIKRIFSILQTHNICTPEEYQRFKNENN